MFYSSKDCLLTVANNSFIARELELTTQADVLPVYDITSPYNLNYAANNGLQGILKFSYYLTGADFLKPYLSLEGGSPLSVNVGGMTLSNGYIRTYQTNLAPNEPVVISTEIIFFDKITGTFTPNASLTQQNNIPVMHISDLTLNTADSLESVGNIVGINYSFTNDIKSSFNINSTIDEENISPDRVFFGVKEARIEVITDSTNMSLPIYGQPKVGAIVTLQTPDGSATETLVCSGQLLAKSFSTSVNQVIQNKFSIVTNNLRDRMAITSFSPSQGSFYNLVDIYGEGLDLVDSVFFGDKNSSFGSSNYTINILSDTHIRVGVPIDSMTARIRIRSIHGDVISSNEDFTINAPTPIISETTAFSLNGYQTKNYSIAIEGLNFHRPSRVLIGGTSVSFVQTKSDRNYILARPPEEAVNSYIILYEDDYGYSGVSPNKTNFPAFLRTFSPITGKPGDVITLGGRNFTDIPYAYIKDTNGSGLISASLSVSNDTTALLTVPSGNVNYSDFVFSYSPITYSDLSSPQVSVLQARFWPATSITGFHPPTVGAGQNLRISGFNFQAALMYASGTDVEGALYDVYFNGGIGRFRRMTDTLMTGYVPLTATQGAVGIRANHSVFHLFSNNNLVLSVRGLPTITRAYKRVFPFEALNIDYGQSIDGVLEGTYLDTVTTIRFVGVAGAALTNGATFDITSSAHFTKDPNGKKILLKGFGTVGKDFGEYSISVLNDIGWSTVDSSIRLTIGDKVNLVVAAQRITWGIIRPSETLYGPEKLRDGITNGSFANKGIAIVGGNGTDPEYAGRDYFNIFWEDEIIVRGFDIYAEPSDASLRFVDTVVDMYDKNLVNLSSTTLYPAADYNAGDPNTYLGGAGNTFRSVTLSNPIKIRQITISKVAQYYTSLGYLAMAEFVVW